MDWEKALGDDQFDKYKQEAGNLGPANNVHETVPECCLTCEYCFHAMQSATGKCMRPDGPTFSLAGLDSIFIVCDGWKSDI